MAKKLYWSKCLENEWDTLRAVCKKLQLDEKQGTKYICDKALILPQTNYQTVVQTSLTMLLSYDVYGKVLHLYFMDKELRDFFSSVELIDYEDLKAYIIEHGNFYPIIDYNGIEQPAIIDFPFCIHIPYEKHGYAFNCQLVNGRFHLVAEKDFGIMLNEKQYNFLKEKQEKANGKALKELKLYKLAFNTIAYINCFKEYVKDGPPDLNINYQNKTNTRIIEISKELHEDIKDFLKNPSIRSPHFRRGHIMYLKSERYTNKRGELVWRKTCMVKGKAKTVYTNEKLLQDKEWTGGDVFDDFC